MNEASNRSKIGSEYLSFLRFGMLGYDFIVNMAKSGRVIPLSRNVPTQIANKLNRCVTDKTDRIFARVTYNSIDKILITHNLTDLPPVCLSRNLNLQVLEASDYMTGK